MDQKQNNPKYNNIEVMIVVAGFILLCVLYWE